jgi:hypothetical protein
MITTIVIAVLASNGGFALLQFLITRHDTKKNVKAKLLLLEKDVLRTQLLLLILMKPEEKKEILTLGQHYFVDLEGNWYMTDIFNKWLESNGEKPEWFKKPQGGR